MEEKTQSKKPRIYSRDFNEAVDHLQKKIYGEMEGIAKDLFKDLSKHFTRRLIILNSVYLLIALGISYTALTFSLKEVVRKYAEEYISKGKQYAAAQIRIEKNQEELKDNHDSLANNQASLEKRMLEQANELYRVKESVSSLDKSNKEQFIFIKDKMNNLESSFEQYKKNLEKTMKSDYKEFLDLNNSTLKEVKDLSAKVTAYEKELPKTSAYDKRLNDIISDIGNLTTKIGELNRNIEKTDRESISKEDYNKLKNELDIIKKDYKPLKEKLEALTKKINEKTE